MQLSFYEATNLQSSVCTSCRVVFFLLAALEVVHIMYMTTTHYLTQHDMYTCHNTAHVVYMLYNGSDHYTLCPLT